MNVSLTDKQEKYIAAQIESGDYQNASELVRDALRLHQIYRDKVIQDLREAVAKAIDGPRSNRSVLDIVEAKKKQYQK